MPDKRVTVCITGHREKGVPDSIWGHAAAVGAVKRLLGFYLDMAADAGYENFLCGMASGTDLWAAEHIAEMKRAGRRVRLIGAVPYLRHAERFSTRDKELLRYAERNADRLVLVNENPYITYSYGGAGSTLYRDRNYYMVDNSSAVISFFTGNSHSGTGQTIRYARNMGRRIMSFGNAEVISALDRAGGVPELLEREELFPENIFSRG